MTKRSALFLFATLVLILATFFMTDYRRKQHLDRTTKLKADQRHLNLEDGTKAISVNEDSDRRTRASREKTTTLKLPAFYLNNQKQSELFVILRNKQRQQLVTKISDQQVELIDKSFGTDIESLVVFSKEVSPSAFNYSKIRALNRVKVRPWGMLTGRVFHGEDELNDFSLEISPAVDTMRIGSRFLQILETCRKSKQCAADISNLIRRMQLGLGNCNWPSFKLKLL